MAALLRFNSNTGLYRLWYDRRWHMMHETPQGAFFRMVEDGELIAQCKVTPLAKLQPGEKRMSSSGVCLCITLHDIADCDEVLVEHGVTFRNGLIMNTA